jgi:hypothetical protein
MLREFPGAGTLLRETFDRGFTRLLGRSVLEPL